VVFQLYDIDGNDVITRNEILQIARSMYKMTDSTVALQRDGDTLEDVWLSDLVPDPQCPTLIVHSPRIVGAQDV
jgi:hypothetical protein